MIPNPGVADFVTGFRIMTGAVPVVPEIVWITEGEVFVFVALPLEGDPEPEEVPCWAVTTKPGDLVESPDKSPDGSADASGSGVSASDVETPGSVPIKRYLKGVAVSSAGRAFLSELKRPIANTNRMPNREKTPSRIGRSVERSRAGLVSGSELI